MNESRTAERAAWREANQRCLTAELDRLRARLELRPVVPVSVTDSPPSTLDTLCRVFGLSGFERDTLLLCAGVELDSEFAALLASIQGSPGRAGPTFSLALALLSDADWGALSPSAALRYWKLVEVGPAGTITQAPLRIDERILHYLTGVQCRDERLAGLVEPVSAPKSELVPSHRLLAERVAAAWGQTDGRTALPLVQLCGADTGTRREIAAAAAGKNGRRLHCLPAPLVPLVPPELATLVRLWEREAALTGAVLLVDCEEADAGDAARRSAVTRLLEQTRSPVLVSSPERRHVPLRTMVTLDVERPGPDEQRALWRELLGAAAGHVNGQVDALVAQFDLSASGIRTAWAEAEHEPAPTDTDRHGAESGIPQSALRIPHLLWDTCRRQARPRMDDLAQRIEPVATWEQLVLPAAQLGVLHEVAVHVRQRAQVYEAWGFLAQSRRGLGISALFSGPSGTGKTLAAEVLANELRLDLYRIDLSAVVSKYIGETEKNLRRVFDAAEAGGAILLFDEADALFGKRSEVRDSHDRYANIEVSYLLQRMEAYRGLAILTSNMKEALDRGFLRRIRFVVQFPFPDAALRAEIWRRVFPRETPVEGLDMGRLGRLNVPGGNIRNIALHAAFLAADAGEPVRMRHLLRAARVEYAKLERPLPEAEVGGWV